MTDSDPWVPGRSGSVATFEFRGRVVLSRGGVPRSVAVELRVVEHGGVSGGAGDAEPEQVADAADVAAGGVQFVEDADLDRRVAATSTARAAPRARTPPGRPTITVYYGHFACGAAQRRA